METTVCPECTAGRNRTFKFMTLHFETSRNVSLFIDIVESYMNSLVACDSCGHKLTQRNISLGSIIFFELAVFCGNKMGKLHPDGKLSEIPHSLSLLENQYYLRGL